MARRSLDRSHSYLEVQQHFDHHPNVRAVRQSGSHKTYIGPRGNVTVPVGHRGDMPPGTLKSIIKAATLAGLFCLVLAFVAPFVI